ncbi:hypothetical protein AeMF1_007903 [Aphanomyces euteiches]|nr:hypothetical protein AeMF1_007903 [Aphanomyces euteiches]KAH9168957.1 hypothetical protein AeNC1_017818 [Aphanomyces euteiches]
MAIIPVKTSPGRPLYRSLWASLDLNVGYPVIRKMDQSDKTIESKYQIHPLRARLTADTHTMKRPADDSHDATKRPKTLTHPSHQVEEHELSQTANPDTSNLDLTNEAPTIPDDETKPFDDVSIRLHLDEQARSEYTVATNKHQGNRDTRSKTPEHEEMKTRTTTPAPQDIEAQTTSDTTKTANSVTSDGHLHSVHGGSSASEAKKAIKSAASRRHENHRVMFSTATTYLFEWDVVCKEPTLARRHVREKTKILKCVTFLTATTYVFEREIGGSAVANGPALGLARRHCEECTVDISKTDDEPKGKPVEVHYKQRYSILKKAGVPLQDMVAYCKESFEILKSRDATKLDIRLQEQMNAYYLAQHKVIAFNQRLRNGEEDMMF